jgi:hypothetical protein
MILGRTRGAVDTVDTVDTVDMAAKIRLRTAPALPVEIEIVQSRVWTKTAVRARCVHPVHPVHREVWPSTPNELITNRHGRFGGTRTHG